MNSRNLIGSLQIFGMGMAFIFLICLTIGFNMRDELVRAIMNWSEFLEDGCTGKEMFLDCCSKFWYALIPLPIVLVFCGANLAE